MAARSPAPQSTTANSNFLRPKSHADVLTIYDDHRDSRAPHAVVLPGRAKGPSYATHANQSRLRQSHDLLRATISRENAVPQVV